MKRRAFLGKAAATGAGLVVLKSGILGANASPRRANASRRRAGVSPNEKLNIAVIGVGSRDAPGRREGPRECGEEERRFSVEKDEPIKG
jgi:hypothetical protein